MMKSKVVLLLSIFLATASAPIVALSEEGYSCASGDCQNGVGRLEGDGVGSFFYYEGAFVDGERSGHGTEVLISLKYVGEWKDGKKHGKGKTFDGEQLIYKGEYQQGDRHGMGAMYKDGWLIYEGEFENNNMHGLGTYYMYDSEKLDGYKQSFTGEVRNSSLFFGKLFSKDGSLIYEGEWADDTPTGEGTLYYADGITYKGEVHDGKQHGFGRIHGSDGSIVFECMWVEGKREGKGIIYNRSANTKAYVIFQDDELVERTSVTMIDSDQSDYRTCMHEYPEIKKIEDCLKANFNEKYELLRQEGLGKEKLWEALARETRLVNSYYDIDMAVKSTVMNVSTNDIAEYLKAFSDDERQAIKAAAGRIQTEAQTSLSEYVSDNKEMLDRWKKNGEKLRLQQENGG
jgi:hypothetical protein